MKRLRQKQLAYLGFLDFLVREEGWMSLVITNQHEPYTVIFLQNMLKMYFKISPKNHIFILKSAL